MLPHDPQLFSPFWGGVCQRLQSDAFVHAIGHERRHRNLHGALSDELTMLSDCKKVQGTLDPITKELIAFDDDEDLQAKIDIMYNRLDVDHDGGLGFEEFQVRFSS